MNGKVVDCEDITAVFCEVHGDCSCTWIHAWLTSMTGGPDPMQVGDYELHIDELCPLHGEFTDHPRTVGDHPVRRPDGEQRGPRTIHPGVQAIR